jgi:hypothetical protein
MAGVTILWGGLELCLGARIDMALSALHLCVGSSQLKCNLGVVEIMTVAVNPIVACKAVGTEIEHVTCHEGGIYLVMTGDADVLIETCVNLGVAVVTTECGAVAFSLVGGQ